MSNHTALVESLTAEVRVLMVGNRQVTQSVARQLDRAAIHKVEAFGRVSLGKGHPDHLVIGRHLETGALVTAEYGTRQGAPCIAAEDLDAPVIICRGAQPTTHYGEYQVRFNDRLIVIERDAAEGCKIDGHGPISRERCDYWDPNGQDANIAAAIAAQDAEWQPHAAAAELPLIVLAGLR